MNTIQTSTDSGSPSVAQKINALKEMRKELLTLSPEKALNAIISCKQPLPLVHSIPAQDLFVLIHEIGLNDALPILSMASEQQWLYIMDAQIWKRDRLCMTETTRWLYWLQKSDPIRFIQWVIYNEHSFFYFYLYQNLEILALNEDEDYSDLPDSFFTMDNVFYVTISDYRLTQTLNREAQELREEFILEFFKRLASFDHLEYQKLLLAVSAVLPAEIEEESFRQKNIRLESFGFLPFEEAIGLYQPIPRKTFFKSTQYPSENLSNTINPPQLPVQSIPGGNYFSQALMNMDSDDIRRSSLHVQFACLCNQIISADNIVVTSRETLKKVVDKACGYIHIGIESLLDNHSPEPQLLTKIVNKYPIKHLFQWGFGIVLKVKWKADAWYGHSFVHGQGLPLEFWGERWLGVLGGLLLKRPRYYADFETGELYRDFRSMSDIKHVETVLKQIIALDEMLSFFSVSLNNKSDYQLTFQNMLLTLFARDQLQLSHELLPIPIEQFQPFFESMFISGGINPLLKESFCQWFARQTGFDIDYVNNRLGGVFDQLFDDVCIELGNISLSDLEPRYVYLFLLT
ncbi:MAG: metal-dependent hydrolase of the beta-lactamase superfamily, partial [Candidatus Magnetoglobus multicellularis str. Araruama]